MSTPQDDHNHGQEDGSEAGWFDEVVERFNPFSSPEYKDGFDNGLANQPNEDED